MQIHSSSLIPVPYQSKRPVSEPNGNGKQPTGGELKSADATPQHADAENANRFSSAVRQERAQPPSPAAQNLPTNSRILKALNSYTETVRQPQQEQVARSLGVDFFV